MKKYLYLDGASGIAGDMLTAALLDLAGGEDELAAAFESLGIKELEYRISRGKSYSISGCDFDVILPEHHHHEHDEHEHHHEHGEHDHHHHEHHEHEHHHHEHDEHEHHHHAHEHRNLAGVYAIIDRGKMTASARELAKKIFRIVAEAEAQAHGCPVEEVHFHEVGALDSIADIVAIAVLFDRLKVDGCVVRSLAEGHGTVLCQHGELPVPVPAVLNISGRYGIKLESTGVHGEMVTPTGIAAAAALRTLEELPSPYQVKKVGIGLGKRDFGRPNFLRAMIIEAGDDSVSQPDNNRDNIVLLESNIDDSSGEELGFLMEKLFEAGARDVHFIPCYMKKNRPAVLLRVVASEKDVENLELLIFRESTTIGIRKFPLERSCMKRKIIQLQLPGGPAEAKVCSIAGIVRAYPEFESVKQYANANKIPFRKAFEEIKLAAEKNVEQN